MVLSLQSKWTYAIVTVYNTHGQIIQSVVEGIILKASVHLQHEKKQPKIGVAHLLKKRQNDPKQFGSHHST